MTIEQSILESRRYLGAGTYRALGPVITEHGITAGWSYQYPMGINLKGVALAETGETLDSLFSAGVIELREQPITAV